MEAITLNSFVRQTIDKYPNIKREVLELVQLCQDEIEEGGSPYNERQLCYSSIQDLIDEQV